MRTFLRWLAFVLAALAAGVAALLWATRDAPLLSSFFRIDGLGLFFVFVAIVGALRDVLVHERRWRTTALFLAVSALTLTARATPLIALGYIALALGSLPHGSRLRFPAAFSARTLGSMLGAFVAAAPLPLAAACVATGYGSLALRGVVNYDDRLAGAALDSMVFWFVLLGAALALVALRRPQNSKFKVQRSTFNVQHSHFDTQNLVLLWFYPLVRLYSLGPWNSGWGLATLLFGAATALWLAVGALRSSAGTYSVGLAALALACFGLGTSAGIAGGCYAILVCAALGIHHSQGHGFAEPGWPIGQLVAPCIAIWLIIGAAVAGGSVALTGVAWVVALLGGLALVLTPQATPQVTRRASIAYAGVSLALGIGAPALIGLLITPAIAQLQGGLSAYGDLLIWPWVGLAVVNSAQVQVAVLPSVAVAVLMIVLIALLYLLKQLMSARSSADDAEPGPPIAHEGLLDALRHEVPWLGGHHDQGRPIDPE